MSGGGFDPRRAAAIAGKTREKKKTLNFLLVTTKREKSHSVWEIRGYPEAACLFAPGQAALGDLDSTAQLEVHWPAEAEPHVTSALRGPTWRDVGVEHDQEADHAGQEDAVLD